MSAYIYGLVDPRDNSVRYIGWTIDPPKRLSDHFKEARTGSTHKCNWVKSLWSSGVNPVMKILVVVERYMARTTEISVARLYRNLTNQTPGGDIEPGGWNRGKTKFTDHRVARAAAGISRAMRGNTNGRGVHHTDELKERQRRVFLVKRNEPGFQERINAAKALIQQIPWNRGLTKADPRVANGLAVRRERHGA